MDRFWRKVNKTDSCWLWLAGKDKDGYGRFKLRSGKSELAHRVAWILTYGQFKPFQMVLHKCSQRECVNPEHLELGYTKFEDGEFHPLHKLKTEEVGRLKKLIEEGYRDQDLLANFSVSRSEINHIRHGRRRRNG